MNASELPSDIRKSLLEDIENKLGYSEYRKMVDALGEDGMLDMVLDGINKQSAHTGSSNNSGTTFWEWLWIIIVLLTFPAFFVMGGMTGLENIKPGQNQIWVFISHGFGQLFVWMCCVCPQFLWYLVSEPFKLIFKARNVLLRYLILVIVIAGFAVGLWYAIPWLWRGTVDWWKWLSGHF